MIIIGGLNDFGSSWNSNVTDIRMMMKFQVNIRMNSR